MECPWPDTFRFCWRAVYVATWCLLLLFPGGFFDCFLLLLLVASSLRALLSECAQQSTGEQGEKILLGHQRCLQPVDPRSKLEQKTHQSLAGYKYSKAIIKPYRTQCTHCFACLYECIRKKPNLVGAGDPRERT